MTTEMKKTMLICCLWFGGLGVVFAIVQHASITQAVVAVILLVPAGLVIGARWSHVESSRERRPQPGLDAGGIGPSPRKTRLRHLALWSILALPTIVGVTSILLGAAGPAYYFGAGLALGLANSVTLYMVGTRAGNW